jgi:lipocalin
MFSLVSSQTVPSLNVSNYLGRWYQVYSDFAVEATFENNSYCVTADYGLNSNNTISVLNRERNYNVSGPIREIFGWAEQSNPIEPGELEVNLQGTSFPAPYWIYQLGPENYNGTEYEYSIVSDPLKLTLFVLTRNISRFQQYWETNVLNYLKEQNFTGFLNTPIPTVQDGCIY